MSKQQYWHLILVAAMASLPSTVYAQGKPAGPLNKQDASAAIVKLTRIGLCAQADPPVFSSVLTAPAVEYKPASGIQETKWIYPVKAEYTVHCTQGNRNMKHGEVMEWQVEVRAYYRFYRDPFGELQIVNTFDSDYGSNQDWKSADTDVHCRDKRLAYLTYDPSGKVTNRRVDDSTAYGDCSVRVNTDK